MKVNKPIKPIIFPESFEFIEMISQTDFLFDIGKKVWKYNDKKTGRTLISVIGGGHGAYGDGVTTFEMWDQVNEEDPIGPMTKEEIQDYLDKVWNKI